MKNVQKVFSKLKRDQVNMGTKVISEDIPPSEGYEGGYNEYNQNYEDLEEIYEIIEDFHNGED